MCSQNSMVSGRLSSRCLFLRMSIRTMCNFNELRVLDLHNVSTTKTAAQVSTFIHFHALSTSLKERSPYQVAILGPPLRSIQPSQVSKLPLRSRPTHLQNEVYLIHLIRNSQTRSVSRRDQEYLKASREVGIRTVRDNGLKFDIISQPELLELTTYNLKIRVICEVDEI